MTARWSLLVGAALLGGCGGTIVDGQDGAADAGGDGSSGVCNPELKPFPDGGYCGSPDLNARQLCQLWAQSLITSGYAYASCGNGDPYCQMGNHCAIEQTGIYQCDCNGMYCDSGEACVSDIPNGPVSCRPICVSDCPADGCKEPGAICRCFANNLCGLDEICVGGNCEPRSSCPDQ